MQKRVAPCVLGARARRRSTASSSISFSRLDAGVVARRLRAVAAVLRAAAGLDRQQRRQLHRVGREVLAVHLLRAEQQVVERQRRTAPRPHRPLQRAACAWPPVEAMGHGAGCRSVAALRLSRHSRTGKQAPPRSLALGRHPACIARPRSGGASLGPAGSRPARPDLSRPRASGRRHPAAASDSYSRSRGCRSGASPRGARRRAPPAAPSPPGRRRRRQQVGAAADRDVVGPPAVRRQSSTWALFDGRELGGARRSAARPHAARAGSATASARSPAPR